jgi:GNAT superfamily N-acetyltransferase
MNTITLRDSKLSDADAIGTLHAQSWFTAYRGILLDSYLDNDLQGERQRYWREKLTTLSSKEFIIVAEDGSGVVGFAAVMDEPESGYDALLDNLHVRPDLKGKGLGGRLMKAVAERLRATGRSSFYLWVLKGNVPAEEFYKAKSGVSTDVSSTEFGGKTVGKTRFVWTNLSVLTDRR